MNRIRTFAAAFAAIALSHVAWTQSRRPDFPQPPPAREVTVPGIPGVIAPGAKWALAWQGSDNADGIVGTSDGGLLFAQEQPSRISKLDANDHLSVFLENTHGAGALSIDSHGRILAVERTCTDPGLRPAPCTEPTAVAVLAPERKILADHFGEKGLGRLNDLIADRRGGIYFNGAGTFYLAPAGVVHVIGHDIRTNGITLSPDEKTLYVTNGPALVAFDVQPDGAVTHQRDFARLEAGGVGDGMAIDAQGRLYVTSAPGVQVFNAQGEYLGLIPTPRPVISAAFSGPDKQTLYLVGSGALGPDGREYRTPAGVRNNGKSIYKIRMLAEGFRGRVK